MMDAEIDKQPQCVLCDKNVKSSSDGWRFKKFNLCFSCIERIFQDI
jgi:hypothetical protein